MTITAEVLEKLVFNPTKMAIWSEIIKYPFITSKELMKNLNIKKSKMYYNLKEMEELKILYVKIVTVKNSNLSEKHYTISKEFDNIRLGIDEKQIKKTQRRDYQLFKITLTMAHLNQEMRRLLKISNEEFVSTLNKKEIDNLALTGLLYFTAEEEKRLKKDFKEFFTKTQWEKPIDFSKSKEFRRTFYYGFIDP
ncbi:MAG: helix-turn-helix transcriptional regulator [Candidatus Lokiarchaeota archaeon]|nr:helix-turn-helix transcriptional regulator [Candidatus Lokiarchaeota archaeon]